MSVVSESVSQTTLITAYSKLDLQNDGLDLDTADTPMPRGNISDETIELIRQATAKLDNPNKGQDPHTSKRARRDSGEASTSKGPDRSNYATETKPIYLRIKTNQRRKISFASQINRMHSELLKGAYPACVQFKFNCSSNRSDKVRKAWEIIIKECKEKLTKVLLDDLFYKYSSTKESLMKDYDELAHLLEPNQVTEIKESLKKRDLGLAPLLAEKNKRQYEPPKPRERRQVIAKRRRASPAKQPRQNRRTNNK